MSMAFIRDHYGVPAKRGGRVTYQGKPGTIVNCRGSYLKVRLDGAKTCIHLHPKNEVEYEV